MEIAGFQPATLSDYPGHVAAIVFTRGCNFRCPFCHNGDILDIEGHRESPSGGTRIPEDFVLEQLTKRRRLLTGVVVTGGEPTIQADLLEWLQRIKTLGYKIKLDTNGSNPRVVKDAIGRHLVDFIAMDVKAPPEKYPQLAGLEVDLAAIERSIAIIADSRLPHEFRTTNVTPLLTEEDLQNIKASLPRRSPFRVQAFLRENALDATLRAPCKEQIAS